MGFWSLWSCHRKSHQPLSNLFTHSSHMWYVIKHALVRWLWSSVVTSWLSNEIVYYKFIRTMKDAVVVSLSDELVDTKIKEQHT